MKKTGTNSGSRDDLPRSIGLGDSGTPDLAERYEECLSGFGFEGIAHDPQLEEREDIGIQDTSEDP